MIGTLILTHGGMARELLAAAQKISAAPLSGVEALALDWQEPFDAARVRVAAAIDRLDQGQGVLILTDMYGSTASNVALSFYEPGKVEILSGVNLPMILRLTCGPCSNDTLCERAHWLLAKAQKSLCVASDVIQPRKCENGPLAATEKGHD